MKFIPHDYQKYAMKFIPHDYQKYAIKFIEQNPIAAILLDMGLG